MKLTQNLRRAIITQFRDGQAIPYIAALYRFTQLQIEDVIRRAMQDQDVREQVRAQANGEAVKQA